MPECYYDIPYLGPVALDLPDVPSLVSLQSHIPGIDMCDAVQPCLRLSHEPRQAAPLYEATGRIMLGGAWSSPRVDDTPHLLYALVRRHWIEASLYPVHAAAVVGRSGKAVLLAGSSGVGKTTLCDALASQTDWRFVSGNKTLISIRGAKIGIVSATTTRSILQPDGSRTQIQVDTKNMYPIEVGTIVLPYLNEGAENWRQLSPLSALHTLFPLCLDAMNADVVIDAGSSVVSGSVSALAKQNLAASLGVASGAIPVYRGAGSLGFLLGKIEGVS